MEDGPSPDSEVLCLPGGQGVVGCQQRPGVAGQREAVGSECEVWHRSMRQHGYKYRSRDVVKIRVTC